MHPRLEIRSLKIYLSSYEGFMVDTIPMSCALVRKEIWTQKERKKTGEERLAGKEWGGRRGSRNHGGTSSGLSHALPRAVLVSQSLSSISPP